MSSSWIRKALKYALLLTPTLVLAGLIALVAAGAWVAAILREPAKFADAPTLIQKLTRTAYWHTRRHWHTVPECVQFDPELLYRPRPGECVFENAEFRTTMHFDAGGARRTAAPAAVSGPASPRILVLGDSHAMGWGVGDEETFASVLASEYGFPVLNLAVSSYATPRELRRLERDFEVGARDVIVIQYCDNDLRENRHFAATRRVGPYAPAELDRLFDYPRTEVSAMPLAGLLLRELWARVLDHVGLRHDANVDAGLAPTAAFIEALSAAESIRNHTIIVVAINAPGSGTHLDKAALDDVGILLIEPAFAGADFYSIDDHMRPRGHRIVARAIAESLSAIAGRPLHPSRH